MKTGDILCIECPALKTGGTVPLLRSISPRSLGSSFMGLFVYAFSLCILWFCLCSTQARRLNCVDCWVIVWCMTMIYLLSKFFVFTLQSTCSITSVFTWLSLCFVAVQPPVKRRPQTTCLYPALSWAAASTFLQAPAVYLYPALHLQVSFPSLIRQYL